MKLNKGSGTTYVLEYVEVLTMIICGSDHARSESEGAQERVGSAQYRGYIDRRDYLNTVIIILRVYLSSKCPTRLSLRLRFTKLCQAFSPP